MEKLCRFCLKTSNKNLCSLQACDILSSIQECLTLKISTDDSFPNNLCKECFKTISLIIKFCKTFKEKEDKLQYYSKIGLLQDYYSNIINNMQNEQKALEIKKRVEVEYGTNIYFDHLTLKKLSSDRNMANCSSDHGTTLTSTKIQKAIINTAPLTKITILRPLKTLNTSRRKKTKEPENIEYIKPFTCLTCLDELSSQADLTEHYYAEHYQRKTHGKKYTEQKTEDETMYICDSCKEMFKLKRDIVKHVMCHRDARPLICKLCARTYKTVSDIILHARAHNGFKLECPYNCGYTTAYKAAMKQHKNRHLGKYKYTCKTCGKGFNSKPRYEEHPNLHTGEKPFVCNICNVAFSLSRYLQTHKTAVHPQSSSFKRYRCVHCDEECGSSRCVSIHLQKHGINKETEFLCDFCGKLLKTTSQLQYHRRMHLGIKPYACNICQKKFAKKYSLNHHMNTHTGEKSYSCSRCGKRYSRRYTLLTHLKSCNCSGGTSS